MEKFKKELRVDSLAKTKTIQQNKKSKDATANYRHEKTINTLSCTGNDKDRTKPHRRPLLGGSQLLSDNKTTKLNPKRPRMRMFHIKPDKR